MEKAYIKYKLCKYYEGFLGKITDFIWFKPLTYGKCPPIAT